VLLIDKVSSRATRCPRITFTTRRPETEALGIAGTSQAIELPCYSKSFVIFRASLPAFAVHGPRARGETYCPRRTILDALLIQAAAKAGAEVRERFLVSNVLHNNGSVCGVSGHTALSKTISERATLTIGADGFNSLYAARRSHSVCSIPMNTYYAYSYWIM